MFIGEANHKGASIMVGRDEHGKFFITRNGQQVGVKLNATEMCRWFLNAMHEEPTETNKVELRIESDKFLKQNKRIDAIKYVREHTNWGLKEAYDYIKTSTYY